MFQIILSNTKQIIPVLSLGEVKTILDRINCGDKIIICSHGIFNPSYLVAILEDTAGRPEEIEMKRKSLEGKISKFAELIKIKRLE